MYDDLKSFNAKWIGKLMQSQMPADVVDGVPALPPRLDRDAVSEITLCMSSVCTKLLVKVDELRQIALRQDVAPRHETSSIQAVSMLHEWLSLARLMAKDARSGHYGSMINMHLSWDEVQFLSGVSNADINRLAVRLGNAGRPVLGWSWPNLFKGAREVHPNLYQSYAVALAA